ncbi:Uncharacterised protein r2_g449 [Pycnogonum litorale]
MGRFVIKCWLTSVRNNEISTKFLTAKEGLALTFTKARELAVGCETASKIMLEEGKINRVTDVNRHKRNTIRNNKGDRFSNKSCVNRCGSNLNSFDDTTTDS